MSLLRTALIGLLVASATAANVVAQDVLPFDTDLIRAQQTAAQTNRLLLVHFWGTWCPPCMRMEKETFSKPGLGTLLSPYYVAAKVQVEQGMNEEVAQRFGVDGFPCDIVLNAQGQIVHKSKGFHTAEQYTAMLHQVAQGALSQARPVAAGAPPAAPPAGAAPPATAPAPSAAPTTAAAPPSAAPAAAASQPTSDDRYAYYYKDRSPSPSQPAAPPATAAAPVPAAPAPAAAAPIVPIPTPTPVTQPTAPAPAAAATPAPAASLAGDRYADYRSNAAPTTTPAPAAVTPNASALIAAASMPVAPTPVASTPIVTPTTAPAPAAATNVAPTVAAPAAVPPAAPVATSTPAAPVTAPAPATPPAPAPITAAAAPATPPVAAPAPTAPAPTAAAVVTNAVITRTTENNSPAAPRAAEKPAPAKPATAVVQLPVGCPPLALDGYCPVTVSDKMVWKKGDVRYGAIHRGRTYLFASADDQQKFMSEPDKYSPIISGNDPVVALEKGTTAPGKREYGLMYKNRMFLFSSKESYDKFCGDSKRYAGEIFQAMQAADLKRR